MDGLSVTCRTCGVKTSFEAAGNHICRARPLQQYSNGFGERGPSRSNDLGQRGESRSDISPPISRGQFPPRKGIPDYNSEPGAPPPRDDLSLGPNFNLASLRAPHSYNNGPYAAIVRPESRGRPDSRNGPEPRDMPGRRISPQRQGFGSRPPIPRNAPHDGPRGYPNEPPRQQQGPPRPQYIDDYDYSRPQPNRMNAPLPDPRYNSNRPMTSNSEPPLRSPLFNRPNPDPRDRNYEQYRDQRPPMDRLPPNTDNRPGSRQRNMDTNPYDARTSNGYDRRDLPRSPPAQPNPYDNQPPRGRPNNNTQLSPPVEETELWRQIRNQAQARSRSIDSSRSSGSQTSRSRQSETPPSSAASPVSPNKTDEYPKSHSNTSLNSVDSRFNKNSEPTTVARSNTKVTMPTCRACDEPIRGRSLASQDGKLSGRYHKRCFCCTTCQKPFETATFYVFMDRPYCKRHYHELNHSTCAECGEGVEGQCLQLEDATIRHPSCFTCATCHIPLNEDYFESNGLPYCDRHARLLAQKDRRMEKRKTRLLVM